MNETALGGVHACGLDFILNQAEFVFSVVEVWKGQMLG